VGASSFLTASAAVVGRSTNAVAAATSTRRSLRGAPPSPRPPDPAALSLDHVLGHRLNRAWIRNLAFGLPPHRPRSRLSPEGGARSAIPRRPSPSRHRTTRATNPIRIRPVNALDNHVRVAAVLTPAPTERSAPDIPYRAAQRTANLAPNAGSGRTLPSARLPPPTAHAGAAGRYPCSVSAGPLAVGQRAAPARNAATM
jgi:hypothetical protein